MKREYIKRVFTDLKTLKYNGIWLSGIQNEGEYKMWWEDGQLRYHELYKDGKMIKDYLK